MKKGPILLMCIIAVVAFAILGPDAQAFEFYSDATNDQGQCAQCHTGFKDNKNYFSEAERLAWGTSLHDAHLNNTTIGENCDNCHGGAGTAGRTVNLESSGASADGVNAISCMGCHGRLEDAKWGAGLRLHHANSGISMCSDCHSGDPAVPVGEDTMPPWYADTLNTTATLAMDPCNPAGEENFAGSAIGLDNDGDLYYDTAAPDCQVVVKDPPVAVDDLAGGAAIVSTPVNTPVDIDVLANDTDANNDILTVNSDFDTASAKGGTVTCSVTANTPTQQCTYTPATNVCGADTFTYRAFDGTDPSANRATVTIDVGDANPPVVTASTPDPLVITVPAGTTSVPATDPVIAAWLDSATANDVEEGPLPVSNNAPADFPLGDTPVTFSATDNCGNTGTSTAALSVVSADNNVPLVTDPAPISVTAPLCATSVPQTDADIAAWLDWATADDVEDGPLPVSNNAPANFPLGDTTVIFSATDSLGATGSSDSTATVIETPNTAPTVTAPAPITITVPQGTTSVPVTDPAIQAFLAGASADDAEDGPLPVSNDAPANFPLGITTVTFSATDVCGLMANATSTVTIQEEAGNTPPQLTVPDSITVTATLCAVSVPATDPAIDAFLSGATAIDQEDGDLTALITNDAQVDFQAAITPGMTTTVTFSVTDSGAPTGKPMTTTGTSTITAVDPNTAPVVTAPAPLTLTVLEGTISVPATDPAVAAFLASATANDAEDGQLGVSNDAPTDVPLGTTMISFSGTDSCGVVGTSQSTVTIQEGVRGLFDLDIAQLQVTKRVRLSAKNPKLVSIKLVVSNRGEISAQSGTATVIGMQNGMEVYNEILQVSAPVGKGRTTWLLPDFIPDTAGDINWTVTIIDNDPDVDEATGTTTVVP